MIKKINRGALEILERQYKSLKPIVIIFSSVMMLLVSGCGNGQESEYKKGANAAIEAAEHSLRAQRAVGNANAITAAETALNAVKAAAKNEADIRKREEAIKAASKVDSLGAAGSAAEAVRASAYNAFDGAATVHTTDAARKLAFLAKQEADKAVAEAKKK